MSALKHRMDSWYNAITGLGNVLRDKVQSTSFLGTTRLTDNALLALYAQNDLAARICEAPVREALRPGYRLTADEDLLALNGALHRYGKGIQWDRALRQAAIWSRVLGGSCLYLGVEDGQVEDQSVRLDRIQRIAFAVVLDKRMLVPETYYDTFDRFGEIETYRVHRISMGGSSRLAQMSTGTVIHESRLIRFEGVLTEDLRKSSNNGWSDSVLERVHNVLRSFGTSWQAIEHLMLDASQAVFKIHNLTDMISSGDKEALSTRMQLVDMSRSVARAILMDADNEDFCRESYSFAGVAEVLDRLTTRLAAAAQMPVTVLMGQSPAGLNATGESDIRLWYDRVAEYQQDHLAPAIERFWELVFAAQDFEGGAPPEQWEVHFGRLWQPSDTEQAALEKTVAEKDKIYIETGVVLPEEIALSRFKATGFALDTQIDLDAREEMRQAEIDLARDKAGEASPSPPALSSPIAASAPEEPDLEHADRQDKIEKRSGENPWVVLTADGTRILGRHKTRAGAERQLRAIEMQKHG